MPYRTNALSALESKALDLAAQLQCPELRRNWPLVYDGIRETLKSSGYDHLYHCDCFLVEKGFADRISGSCYTFFRKDDALVLLGCHAVGSSKQFEGKLHGKEWNDGKGFYISFVSGAGDLIKQIKKMRRSPTSLLLLNYFDMISRSAKKCQHLVRNVERRSDLTADTHYQLIQAIRYAQGEQNAI